MRRMKTRFIGTFRSLYGVSSQTDDGYTLRVSEMRVSAKDTNRADHSFERVILDVPQPFADHNGGEVSVNLLSLGGAPASFILLYFFIVLLQASTFICCRLNQHHSGFRRRVL